jgi:hypothetical protein
MDEAYISELEIWCTWRRVFSASWYWPDMTAHIHRVVYLEESVLGILVMARHDGTHSQCGVPGGECSRRPGTGQT